MKIGIIGGGFTGLTAGLRLSQAGHEITIFEREAEVGGLARSFKTEKWAWPLEQHYHHIFTSDDAILALASELNHAMVIERPITATYYNGQMHQLDSPASLLRFSPLSPLDRLRVGLVLGYLKINRHWQPLERITAKELLVKTMGKSAWEVLWEPLFVGKFGEQAEKIPAAWFWARITKRTPALAYPVRGFAALLETTAQAVRQVGGTILTQQSVNQIRKHSRNITIATTDLAKKISQEASFDKVICTLPTSQFVLLCQQLPKRYRQSLAKLDGIGAINVVLRLKKPFLPNNIYWLNINDRSFPFLALVEHTNFMDKKNYNKESLLYIGNYLKTSHKYFEFSANELLEEFSPYLKSINSDFTNNAVIDVNVFKAPFAQPIFPLHYSETIPSIKTPISGIYLANMQQVYPWDRGTNFAVALGEEVAKKIEK